MTEENPPPPPSPELDERAQAARRRVKGFGTHLVCYFAAMVIAVPLNFWLAPDQVWFVLPMVGWGSVLALHAAYAMGLFEIFKRD